MSNVGSQGAWFGEKGMANQMLVSTISMSASGAIHLYLLPKFHGPGLNRSPSPIRQRR